VLFLLDALREIPLDHPNAPAFLMTVKSVMRNAAKQAKRARARLAAAKRSRD
jgi:hypothetical protein